MKSSDQTAGPYPLVDVIFDEKLQEDAVRELALQVVRWIWRDLIAPASFGTGCSERSPERPDATWHHVLARGISCY
jgi:hypothetical protein